MFWLKLLFMYPMLAAFFYISTGKSVSSLIVCIVMYVLMQISLHMLKVLSNPN